MNKKATYQAINLSCVRQQTSLFSQLSFQLKSGELLLIEGPNGSGKSSLLRLLTGLAIPFEGEIRWNNQSIQDAKATYFEALHYVGHANGIKLGLTVAENLRLTGHLSQSSSVSVTKNSLQCLQLNLHSNTQAKYLSAGQRRRLALAKLFLFPKTLWILDEPLTALDSAMQHFLLEKLEEHLQNGGMSVVSSHHLIPFKGTTVQTLRLNPC